MPELVYKKAGRIELYRHRDGQNFYFNGVVASIIPQITNNSTSLPDGNSDWDYEFTSGRQGQVQVNLNSFQPKLYAALTAMVHTDETDLTMRDADEYTVPSESPYTITVPKTPTGNIVVVNQDDSPFTSGSGAGQYTNSDATFTFNSADAGTAVLIAYDFTAAEANRAQLAAQANNDVFKVTIIGQGVDKDNEAVVKRDNLIFDRMLPTGEISMPPRQREPQGWNFSMKVLRPRTGYKVVDYKVEK